MWITFESKVDGRVVIAGQVEVAGGVATGRASIEIQKHVNNIVDEVVSRSTIRTIETGLGSSPLPPMPKIKPLRKEK